MTDPRPQARWTVAAALGPLSAAVFAAATAWAVGHLPTAVTPSTASGATAADPAAGAAASPAAAGSPAAQAASRDLQRSLDAEAARVAALERLVGTLRAQTTALLHPSSTSGGSGASGGSGSAAQPRGSGSAARPWTPRAATPTAAKTVVRSVARPPAVHTVTGGS